MERIQTLRDSLHHLHKDSTSISERKKFKAISDQLAAIGQPVTNLDKSHLFHYGLGSTFESFCIAYRAIKPCLPFKNLLSQAESHELFLTSIHGTNGGIHGSTQPKPIFICFLVVILTGVEQINLVANFVANEDVADVHLTANYAEKWAICLFMS